MATEYGIRHSQGIRPENSLASARSSIVSMLAYFEKNHRDRLRPQIVSREVTDWEPVSEEVSS